MAQDAPDPRVERTIELFSAIYLGGIPATITHDSAFLSFIAVLSAIEALAGFRHAFEADRPKSGDRFERFLRTYFPPEYQPYVGKMWKFRCRLVHSFSPAGFSLTHHHSENHMRVGDNGNPVLNAEDFYAALVSAAQKYFAELRSDAGLRSLMIARMEDKEGGPINVGPMRLTPGGGLKGGTTT